MGTPIFRHYDQAGLDAEYDNQKKFPGFDFKGFVARCAALSASARGDLACHLDIPYGTHPAERLDIFPAAPAAGAAPVEIFFHGGYWRMLDKRDFSYVAHGFVAVGRTVVVVNYALIPAVDMDALVEQCRRAVAWTVRNIANFGGDPGRLYLSGHSAGGHLVAMMMATDWRRYGDDLRRPLFAGACAISGIFDLEPIQLCFLNKILQLDAGQVERNSPQRLEPLERAPLVVAVGDREGEEYLRQARDFVAAWCRPGFAPEMVVLPEDHFSIRLQLVEPQSGMMRVLLGGAAAAAQIRAQGRAG
jgi:arylformamidase